MTETNLKEEGIESDIRPQLLLLLHELIELRNKPLTAMEQLLAKYEMVQYISFSSLINKLGTTMPKDCLHLLQSLRKQLENSRKHQKFNYHFPVIKERNPLFQEYQMNWFIEQFAKEYYGHEEQSQDEGDQDYCIRQDIKLPTFDLKKVAIEVKSETTNSDHSSSKYSQFKQEADIYTLPDTEYKVPEWFYSHNGMERLSSKRLLSINLTDYFQAQINQVVSMIYQQLEDHKSHVFASYRRFLTNYCKFYLIRSGKYQSELPASRQSLLQFIKKYEEEYLKEQNEYINYCFPEYKSILLQSWESIIDKLRYKMTKMISDDQITAILKSKLEKIAVFFTPCLMSDPMLAISKNSLTAININQIVNSALKIGQFINGPLKPYMAISLYHEITHDFVRLEKTENLEINCLNQFLNEGEADQDDSNRSLSLNKNTIGSKILQLAKNKNQRIQDAFDFCDVTDLSNSNSVKASKTITDKIQSVHSFLNNNLLIINFIRIHNDLLQQIKARANLIYQMKLISSKLIDTMSISKDEWTQIKGYLEKIIQKNGDTKWKQKLMTYIFEQDQSSTLNSYKYKIFFSLLRLYSHCELLSPPSQVLKLFQSLTKTQCKRYFIDENLVVKKLFVIMESAIPSLAQKGYSLIKFMDQQQPFQWFNTKCKELCLLLAEFNFQIQMYPVYQRSQKHENKFKALKNLGLLNIGQVETIQIQNFFKVQSQFHFLMSFLKNSQLFIIASELPDFYLSRAWKRHESGYDIQVRLFPNIFSQHRVYAKDWSHMRKLTIANSQLVGVPPENKTEAALFMATGRQKDRKQHKERIGVKGLVCGKGLYGFKKRKSKQDVKQIANTFSQKKQRKRVKDQIGYDSIIREITKLQIKELTE